MTARQMSGVLYDAAAEYGWKCCRVDKSFWAHVSSWSRGHIYLYVIIIIEVHVVLTNAVVGDTSDGAIQRAV